MAEQKKKWITVKEAAVILTERSGHTVSEAYVRRLGNKGLLPTDQIDGRTKLYRRSDVERYTVTVRGDGSVRRRVRKGEYEAQEQQPEATETFQQTKRRPWPATSV